MTTPVRETVERVRAGAGEIDVLVNNACIAGGGSLENSPMAIARDIMETNYCGAARPCHGSRFSSSRARATP